MPAGIDPARLQRVQQELSGLPEEQRKKVIGNLRDKLRGNELFMDQFVPDPAVEPREGLSMFLQASPPIINPEYLSTAGQNLPFSAAELGREFEGAFSHPKEMLKALAGIVRDVPTAPASALGLTPGQPNRAEDFVKSVGSSIFDPEESARHPLGALAGLASLFQPMAKGPMAKKLLGAAADPITTAVAGTLKLGKEGIKKARVPEAASRVGEVAGGLATEVFGATTGEGGGNIRGLVQSGVASPHRASRARAELKEGSDRAIGRETVDQIQERIDELGTEKRAVLTESNARGVRIDMESLKRRLFGEPTFDADGNLTFEGGVLQPVEGSPGIEIIPASPDTPGAFLLKIGDSANAPKTAGGSTWVKTDIDMAEFLNDADASKLSKLLARIASKNGTISPLELDNLKVRIDHIKGLEGSAQGMTTAIRQEIRAALGAEVPGYNKPVGEMDELFTFLDEAEAEVGTNLRRHGKAPSQQARPTKVQRALKKGFGDESEGAREAIEGLDASFDDLHLRDRLPAHAMHSFKPKGLIGKSAASTAVRATLTAALAGTSAVMLNPIIGGLVGLAAVSPQAVGRIAIELGAGTRQAQRLVQLTQDAIKKAQASGLDVSKMGFAELLERTQNLEESQEPSGQFLRTLNRIDTSSIGGPPPPVR